MARKVRRTRRLDLRPDIESLGLRQVIEQIGIKRVINEIGLEGLLANLSAPGRAELKRRRERAA